MDSPRLVRAIGKWSLVALTINCVIGSSVFGLPPKIAALVGPRSPWAVVLAGLLMGIIIACFAEVASYFSDAGGPYLYARAAFGPLLGIQTGWMFFLAPHCARGQCQPVRYLSRRVLARSYTAPHPLSHSHAAHRPPRGAQLL